MPSYLQHTLTDLSVTATAHSLASSHYRYMSQFVKLPQAIAPTLSLFTSFLSTVLEPTTFGYVTQGLNVVSLLTVGVDVYFGWAKQAESHANISAQYFDLRDKLFKLKHQKSRPETSGKVEAIENEFLVLLSKYRRPPVRYQKDAIIAIRDNQALIDEIERRRSESKETSSGVDSAQTPPPPAPQTLIPDNTAVVVDIRSEAK